MGDKMLDFTKGLLKPKKEIKPIKVNNSLDRMEMIRNQMSGINPFTKSNNNINNNNVNVNNNEVSKNIYNDRINALRGVKKD